METFIFKIYMKAQKHACYRVLPPFSAYFTPFPPYIINGKGSISTRDCYMQYCHTNSIQLHVSTYIPVFNTAWGVSGPGGCPPPRAAPAGVPGERGGGPTVLLRSVNIMMEVMRSPGLSMPLRASSCERLVVGGTPFEGTSITPVSAPAWCIGTHIVVI